jgi:hypothetical protein
MFKTKLAQEVWESKYRYGDETPLGTFERVARAPITGIPASSKRW